ESARPAGSEKQCAGSNINAPFCYKSRMKRVLCGVRRNRNSSPTLCRASTSCERCSRGVDAHGTSPWAEGPRDKPGQDDKSECRSRSAQPDSFPDGLGERGRIDGRLRGWLWQAAAARRFPERPVRQPEKPAARREEPRDIAERGARRDGFGFEPKGSARA